MKALLAAVCVAALLAPLAASAQERGGRGEGRRGGGERAAASAPDTSAAPRSEGRGRGFSGAREGRAERPARAQRPARVEREAQAPQRSTAQAQRGGGGRPPGERARTERFQSGQFQRDQAQRQARQERDRQRPQPSLQNRDPRYAQGGAGRWNGDDGRFDNRRAEVRRYESRPNNQWRNDNRNDRRYSSGRSYQRVRAAPFRWPRGYSSIRWSVRQRLPSVFLMPSYYIQDVYSIGLPYAPPGTEWVRVGNDALLVDLYTGEILDVAQDIFYW